MKIGLLHMLLLPLLATSCGKSRQMPTAQTVDKVTIPSRDLVIPAELLRYREDVDATNAHADEPVSKVADIDQNGLVDVTKLSGKLGKGALILLPSLDSKTVDERWKSIPVNEGQPLSIVIDREKKIALGCFGSDSMEPKLKGVSNFYELMACPISSNKRGSVGLYEMAEFQFKP